MIPVFPYISSKTKVNMNLSILYAKPVCEQAVLAAPKALPLISSLKNLDAFPARHCHWFYISYPLLAWQAAAIVWKFWWKTPVSSTLTKHHQFLH